MEFQITEKDPTSKARNGTIGTDHGTVGTPVFMPVGTLGAVKGVHFSELENDIGAGIILGNTYHLYLRPGTEVLEKAGGLHAFNSWKGPMLTDSGGYQVYSLSHRRKIIEEGASFRSHIDGSLHLFTPEGVMDIQRSIGADFIMAFDECTPYPCDYGYARNSMELTHRWLDRCIARFDATSGKYGYQQTLLPIVQGSTYADLRRASAEFVASRQREANAIGGLSVGEPAEEMYAMAEVVCGILPEDKPRYLMGVGTPPDLLYAMMAGIDLFDCILPTHLAWQGTAFTSTGRVKITRSAYDESDEPLDAACPCSTCTTFTRSYLSHLFKCREPLAPRLLSFHNLYHYHSLMAESRAAIEAGTFESFARSKLDAIDRHEHSDRRLGEVVSA